MVAHDLDVRDVNERLHSPTVRLSPADGLAREPAAGLTKLAALAIRCSRILLYQLGAQS
jgi:hypothetical protein